MADAPKHSVSVAGVVVGDDGRVLVIQRRDNGRWEAPGGVLELGETFEDGVRREVAEETGIIIGVESLTGVYKNLVLNVVAIVYRCHPISGAPTPTAEARDVQWLTVDEIQERLTPPFAVRILDAFTSDAASRAHDGVTLLDD